MTWKSDINKVYQRFLQSGVFIFIDRLDQALLRYSKEIWISFQVGLIEASWDLMRLNHHIKIFCSIRQEAFNNYESPNKQSILGSVSFLRYTKEELGQLLERLSIYYESSSFSNFIGFNDFQHPLTKNIETVSDYLLRHTIYRPRDIVTIANSLHPLKNQITVDILRNEVNTISSQEIAKNLFIENGLFLDGLQQIILREKFLSMIPRNIITHNEMLNICKLFNNQTDCSEKKCLDCSLCHGFSELYNLGLLGFIDKNDIHTNNTLKQKFKKPHDVYGIIKGAIPVKMKAYLIHPSLNNYLKHLRNKYHGEQFHIIPAITVGNDCTWTKKYSLSFDLYLLMEFVKNTDIKNELVDFMHSLSDRNKQKNNLLLNNIKKRIDKLENTVENGEKIYETCSKLLELNN